MAFWNKDEKGVALDEEQVLNVLKKVQDPDLRKDIVAWIHPESQGRQWDGRLRS